MEQINQAMATKPPTTDGPDAPSSPQEPKTLPPDEASKLEKRLTGAVAAANSAKATAEAADSARERAQSAKTTAEKIQAELEAADLEKKAEHYVKMASRLESGAWQGAGAGIGIGAATGMGVGTVVGTVVGGITTIPTAALGGLIGAGAGAIHGPWVKFTGGGKESGDGGGDVDVEVPEELEREGIEVPRDVIVEQAKARGINLEKSKADAGSGPEKVEPKQAIEEAAEEAPGVASSQKVDHETADAKGEQQESEAPISKKKAKEEEESAEPDTTQEPEESTSKKGHKDKQDSVDPDDAEEAPSEQEPEKQPAKKRKTVKPKASQEDADAPDPDEMAVDGAEPEEPVKRPEEHGMGIELINKEAEDEEVLDEGKG